MIQSAMKIVSGLALAVALALMSPTPASADPAPSVTILSDGFSVDHEDAIRAESAIRGLRVEVLDVAGTDSLAGALAERPEVEAVVWLRDTGANPSIVAVAFDGRQTFAPITQPLPSGRTVAAIVSSLLDHLQVEFQVEPPRSSGPRVPVDTNVTLRATSGSARADAIVLAQPTEVETTPLWYLDIGGLAAPGGILAGHLGLGHRMSDNTRAAVIGHVALIPNNNAATAASVELTRTWGQTLRAELGARVLATMIIGENVGHCVLPEGCGMTTTQMGIGAGSFAGLGVTTSIGTFYVRAGADLVQFEDEGMSITPNGALGMELPL